MIHVVFAMQYMLICRDLILASRLVTNYSTYKNCRRKQVTNNCARLRKRYQLQYKGLCIIQQSCDNYDLFFFFFFCQVSLTATVTCNQYYLLSCGADGAR